MIASNPLSTTESAAVRRDQGHYRCEGRRTLAGIEAPDANNCKAFAGRAAHCNWTVPAFGPSTPPARCNCSIWSPRWSGRQIVECNWSVCNEEHRELLELVRERRAAAGEPPPTTPPRNRLERLGRWVWHHLRRGGDFLWPSSAKRHWR